MTDNVDTPKSVNAVAAALCPSIYLNSEADIANARWHPGFPIHPVYVSVRFLVTIKSLQMKTKIVRKIIKQIKGFYSLSDCTVAIKCRMT